MTAKIPLIYYGKFEKYKTIISILFLTLPLLSINFSDYVFAQHMHSMIQPQMIQPHPGVNPSAQWPGMPGAPVVGYYQPVKINLPSGTRVAFAVNNQFLTQEESPYTVGLLLGANYRLKITNIKFHAGKELFPSVTVLQRTYPPQDKALEYPIQIDLTHEDLEFALSGRFVTRVIYLENPETALPIRGDLGQQPTTEAKNNEDPLRIALNLGKPVAVIQLGGRIPPTGNYVDPFFFYGSPPWISFNRIYKKEQQTSSSLYHNIIR
ncbi:MAG: hypothetical protein LBE18_01470 [Planctomycetaceae bacterium]|jgi:hypothetical protein|nr:hypothetical protein [Planctomycetaceae bacterium]